MSPVKPFLFVHIPKTGGVTFHGVIANQYRFLKRFSYHPREDEKWSKLSDDEKRSYAVVKGHFVFNKDFYPAKHTCFTFLRNPEERIISHYYYMFTKQKHWFNAELLDKQYTLKELLTNGKVRNLDNLMVRFISGNVLKDFGAINEDDLQLALNNFDKYFEHFGLVEKYDESLVIMTYELGWKNPYYVHMNKGSAKKPKETLDKETLDLVTHYARFDKILWEHAKKKFDAKLEKYKDKLPRDLEKFRRGNNRFAGLRAWLYKKLGHRLLR